MDLYGKLATIKGLNNKVTLRVKCTDDTLVEGKYYGFTQALDNETELAQLDILSTAGKVYGLYETETISIDRL